MQKGITLIFYMKSAWNSLKTIIWMIHWSDRAENSEGFAFQDAMFSYIAPQILKCVVFTFLFLA